MPIEFPLIAGLIAASIHVIAGPDHLAAVAPFAIESQKGAWKTGFLWGVGHLLGMLAIGFLFVIFRNVIPIEAISEFSEQLVGLTLIGIGVWSLYRIFKKRQKHGHLHLQIVKQPVIHEHEQHHIRPHEMTNKHHHNLPVNHTKTAVLSIGTLHGLSGIAHFLLFSPVLGFTRYTDSITYILGFAFGTLLAMTTFAYVVGNISGYSANSQNETFFNGIRLAAGLLAIIIGVYWFFSF
ncbi:hypothetical protein [Aegicerativicinus sediminis]